MVSMIKEINDNLKAIIDTINENKNNSINTLENIQMQMDKKVEEAKKYKIQVDSAKERIKILEEENKSLESSLIELSDKYGKMNLVSIVEAGNREIKNKINDNLKDINKEKEHIAELTNRARTIKDLLINLKKDKTIKESKLENIKVVYDYYNTRLNEIIDYAFDHSENLSDYKNYTINYNNYVEEDEEVKSIELENTMVFDEIANIDENKNFKDEMTFINEQIDNNVLNEDISELDKIDEIIKQNLNNLNDVVEESSKDVKVIEKEPLDSTQVFDSILETEKNEEDTDDSSFQDIVNEEDKKETISDSSNNEILDLINKIPENVEIENNVPENTIQIDTDLSKLLNINTIEESIQSEDEVIDEENEMRINKINDLFANFENNTITLDKVESSEIKSVEDKIDNAYMDIFGQPLDSDDLNRKDPTLTDIFGNPVKSEELSNETKLSKKIEELFVENGIDFNKFREDEKNYLKQIYDEEKFNNIIEVLKRNKINLDNIYYAFNIFGEITANELESLISKLINVGQSVEAIGLVLEKLPKVKKYNLDEAIISYGDYVKNIDITELIIKAKELYKNGGNN